MKIDKTLSIFFVIMFMMYTYKVNAQKYDLQYHSNETILSPKQMEEDILEFYNFALEVHPNPFNTLNPAMLDKKVHEIIDECKDSMTVNDFSMHIAKLNQYFDSHTFVLFNFEKWENYDKIKVPNLIEKNGEMYFDIGNSLAGINDTTLYGKKILTIADANLETIKNYGLQYLSQVKLSTQEFVNIYLCDNFNGTKAEVKYLNNDNSIQTTYLTDSDFIFPALKKGKTNYKNSVIVDIRYFPNEDLAVIELNSFLIQTKDEINFYKKAVQTTFDSLNRLGIKNLFVDVTSNGGGNSGYGDQFLSYLSDDTTAILTGQSIFKVSKPMKDWRMKFIGKWKCYYLNYPFSKEVRKLSRLKEGTYWIENWTWKPEKTSCKYKGNVYIIQSEKTFSSATTFVATAKICKLATLIGEETGGLASCYTDIVPKKMKHSKIMTICSSQYQHYSLPEADSPNPQGVLPNIEYKIENPFQSFSLEELKDMLRVINSKKK
jgi:C-terminal processing protease CtpA/Prc